METTFDTLEYFEKLKAAGVPEAQAKVQIEILQSAVGKYDEKSRKELATKGDITDVKHDIANMQVEIQKVKYDMLKWQFGIAVALALIMAKGFGWLGF